MSVKIRRGFKPTPLSGSQAIGSKKTNRKVGVNKVQVKQGKMNTSDPVRSAVSTVAQEIAAGNVEKGKPAINAVIENIVASTAHPSESLHSIQTRTSELQSVLSEDPNFTTRVNRQLDRALSRV